MKKPPKFKKGQVVRLGLHYVKITKVLPRTPENLSTAPHCYLLEGWMCARTESDLRALTKRESGR